MKYMLLLFGAIALFFLWIVIKPIRTAGVLNEIALDELQELVGNDSLRSQLNGPIIFDKGAYKEFRWYKVLEWGDSASVYIDVFKKPESKNIRYFISPRVTMDWQWYYFIFPEGTSKVSDLVSVQNGDQGDKYTLTLHENQKNISDSINFLIKPQRLLYFLESGYFTILEKNEQYVLVDFYEPIANITSDNKNELQTMSAKIYINDLMEVIIHPLQVTDDISNGK